MCIAEAILCVEEPEAPGCLMPWDCVVHLRQRRGAVSGGGS